MSISAGTATDNPCLLIARDKGYDVRVNCYRHKRDNSVECLYFAVKDDVSLSALSGPELLGLVTLWETYGNDWCRQSPDILAEVTTEEDVDDDGNFSTPVTPPGNS